MAPPVPDPGSGRGQPPPDVGIDSVSGDKETVLHGDLATGLERQAPSSDNGQEEKTEDHTPSGCAAAGPEDPTRQQWEASTLRAPAFGEAERASETTQEEKKDLDGVTTNRISRQSDGEVKQQPAGPATTAQMLAVALSNAMKESRTPTPRLQVWLDLVQELYGKIHRRSATRQSSLATAVQRLPTLTRVEKEKLLDLFEDLVIHQGQDWTMWKQQVETMTAMVYRSRQTLEFALNKRLGALSFTEATRQAPVLTQWAQKVKGTTETNSQQVNSREEAFMFNPHKYSPEEIARLRTQCEQTYGKHRVAVFRDGTPDEWIIVQDIVEGNIVCRQLPQFFSRIMGTQEKLRVMATIQAQVEGRLTMALDDEAPVKAAFQSTRRLLETISIGAQRRNYARTDPLWSLLTVVKAISYDAVKHELNFHFYTRDVARRYQGIRAVPFIRKEHSIYNAHDQTVADKGGDAWQLQRDSEGGVSELTSTYVVVLHNVARTMDMGKLYAFLKMKLDVPFELDDLDSCGPQSTTSTSWELRFELDGCPKVLRGITRLVWLDVTIIVQHPYMRGKQQCLRCGKVGHPMRDCRLLDKDLRGPGSIVASETMVLKMSVPPRTFTSMEELRKAIASCPQRRNQPGGTHHGPTPNDVSDPMTTGLDSTRTLSRSVTTDNMGQQDEGWFNGTSKQTASTTAARRTIAEEVRRLNVNTSSKASRPPMGDKQPVSKAAPGTGTKEHPLSIDSSDEQEEIEEGEEERPRTLEELRAENAALMVVEDQVKGQLKEVLEDVDLLQGNLFENPVTPNLDQPIPQGDISIEKGVELMGLRSVQTPGTGNCQAYAVAQAIAGSSFTAFTDQLAELTDILKKGCVAQALTDFQLKFTHKSRKASLLRLGRGWDKMASKASADEFRRYLKEYGSSSSSVAETIPDQLWGSNDTLAAYAMLLQRDILVLSSNTNGKGWGALHYQPETQSKGIKPHAACGEYNLSPEWCIKTVLQLKTSKSPPPIVLRYTGIHYGAYLHGWRAGDVVEEDVEMQSSSTAEETAVTASGLEAANVPPGHAHQDVLSSGTGVKEENDFIMASPAGQRHHVDVEQEGKSETNTLENRVVASAYEAESPWTPTLWSGDLAELERLCEGPTIPHDLKVEIQHILQHGGDRKTELLHFLVNTASQLSEPQKRKLVEADLNNQDVREQYMKDFQISEPVIRQWQTRMRADAAASGYGAPSESSESQARSSDSEYVPSSQDSLSTTRRSRPQRPRRILQRNESLSQVLEKRGHEATPDERKVEGGMLLNVYNAAVPLKKRSGEDRQQRLHDQIEGVASPTRNLIQEFDDAAISDGSPERNEQHQTFPSWPLYWNALAQLWTTRTKIPFPTDRSSVDMWKTAARNEPQLLLEMLRSTSQPFRVMQILAPEVIELWTAQWRELCWAESIRDWSKAQAEINQNTSRARQLRQWIKDVQSMTEARSRRKVLNRPGDWAMLEAEKYGGDPIRQLCAPGKEERLGHHIICSLLYAEKIAVLVGETLLPDTTVWSSLQRHRRALQTSAGFKKNFYTENHGINWETIGVFMGDAVVTGDSSHPTQY